MTAVRTIPTEAEILTWYRSLSNWGRWGDNDELGTLNLITPAKRIQAANQQSRSSNATGSPVNPLALL